MKLRDILLENFNNDKLKKQIQRIIKAQYPGKIQISICSYGNTFNYLSGGSADDDIPLQYVKSLQCEPIDGKIGYDFRIYKWDKTWKEFDLDENFYIVTDENGNILQSSRNPIK